MKTHPTVHELRKKGFKVRVSHNRLFYKYCQWTGRRLEVIAYGTSYTDTAHGCWLMDQYGGRTDVCITDSRGDNYTASTYCSKQDRYIKSFGTKKALLRAYAQYLESNQNFN